MNDQAKNSPPPSGAFIAARCKSARLAEMKDDEDYAFNLRLLIKHPSLTLESITGRMNIEPTHGWGVGRPRQTPAGTILGGTYGETYWGYSERIEGRRDFLKCAVEFIASLEPQHLFLKEVSGTGGIVALDLGLRGKANIGDVLKVDQLQYFSTLGIELGVEVFPNMR
jgi:hypothetical protein